MPASWTLLSLAASSSWFSRSPVHSNIAAENQGRGPFLYDLVQKCFQKLRQILDHLSVTPLHKQPESFPAVSS